MLFQMPTFLEIASELSKTSLQLMKGDPAQRNGDSEGSLGGKSVPPGVAHWDPHVWEGSIVKRDWEIISNLRG